MLPSGAYTVLSEVSIIIGGEGRRMPAEVVVSCGGATTEYKGSVYRRMGYGTETGGAREL